jgi:hypothetical protein
MPPGQAQSMKPTYHGVSRGHGVLHNGFVEYSGLSLDYVVVSVESDIDAVLE